MMNTLEDSIEKIYLRENFNTAATLCTAWSVVDIVAVDLASFRQKRDQFNGVPVGFR